MNIKHIRQVVVAALALGAGLGTSAALAQSSYADAPYPAAVYGQSYGAPDGQAVPYDRFGQFSCAYNEVHTHLERKDCGGIHTRN